ERSAAETGTFGSLPASVRKTPVSPSGTIRLTGSDSPPCGGTRSAMVQATPEIRSGSDVIHIGVLCASQLSQLGEVDLAEMFFLEAVGFLPDVSQDMPAGRRVRFMFGDRGGRRSLDRLDDVPDRNFVRLDRQPVSSGCPPNAGDESRPFQLQQN